MRVNGRWQRYGWALVLALALGPAGCLVPQSIDKSSNAPHVPPRIQVQSIPLYLLVPYSTLQHGQIDVSQRCRCTLYLEVPEVDDEDPLARLEVRWFIDYDPQRPASQAPVVTSFIEGTFDAAIVKRTGPTLPFNDIFGVSDGYHAIDVVIAETGGFDDTNTTLRNRAMRPGYESTEHRFFVQVVTDNTTQCPNVAPSRRSCALADGGFP
ncbi:MAG TPA: hypothetical protein VN883_01790 [Myxococcales bacterium]|nr:hypothetical protein [Myxococcales bacterium]